jgi:hypothetical protein
VHINTTNQPNNQPTKDDYTKDDSTTTLVACDEFFVHTMLAARFIAKKFFYCQVSKRIF